MNNFNLLFKGGIGYSQLRILLLLIDGELSPFIKLFNPSIIYFEVIKLKAEFRNSILFGFTNIKASRSNTIIKELSIKAIFFKYGLTIEKECLLLIVFV